MGNRFKKGDKGEQLVSELLNKYFHDSFVIDNLILLGEDNVSHQFDHILIRPNGIFVIETKNYYGKITGSIDDSYWKKTFMNRGKLVEERFNNPIKQNNAHIRFLKKIIGKDIPFINFVVFVNNDVSSLGIFTVCNENQLVSRIASWNNENIISRRKMQEINDLLLHLEADLQTKDHVDNIKVLKKKQRDIRTDSILVMEKGICPVCGNKITMNKNIYLCSNCYYKLVV